MILGILLVFLVIIGIVGFIDDAIHNPRSGGAYDKLKDYMGWKN